MIKSFGDRVTEDIFHGNPSKKSLKISSEIKAIALRRLDQLNAAVEINDLRVPPGNKLEKLKGNLKDFYSIRINSQFRIIFKFIHGEAHDVKITDYH